jgi:hypothetical protein
MMTARRPPHAMKETPTRRLIPSIVSFWNANIMEKTAGQL